MGKTSILLSANVLIRYGATGRGRSNLPTCTFIKISQMLAMLNDKWLGPTKTSRAIFDMRSFPETAHRKACVSRSVLIYGEYLLRGKSRLHKRGLRFLDRAH